jgi:DNA-binding transcriptional LysR family regulator
MNIHHLELFYYVVKHRGITAASRKMPYGIQQPAISGQISQLEKGLGTKLFHRRPFGLTSAGAKLFAEVEPFFASLNDLPDQIRGHPNQRLRLAAPAIVLRDYLPKILTAHKQRFRNFRLSLHDANQAIAEELLRKREIDLAITELEGRPALSINSRILLRLFLVLIVPRHARFHTITDFFYKGSPSQSLISLPSNEIISKHFQAGLRKLGLAWAPAIEVSSLELIDLYTSLGFGVGLSVAVPGLRRKSGLRVLPLRRFPPLTIAALWSGGLSEPASIFLTDIHSVQISHGSTIPLSAFMTRRACSLDLIPCGRTAPRG